MCGCSHRECSPLSKAAGRADAVCEDGDPCEGSQVQGLHGPGSTCTWESSRGGDNAKKLNSGTAEAVSAQTPLLGATSLRKKKWKTQAEVAYEQSTGHTESGEGPSRHRLPKRKATGRIKQKKRQRSWVLMMSTKPKC